MKMKNETKNEKENENEIGRRILTNIDQPERPMSMQRPAK
jgi:hypothetical protein